MRDNSISFCGLLTGCIGDTMLADDMVNIADDGVNEWIERERLMARRSAHPMTRIFTYARRTADVPSGGKSPAKSVTSTVRFLARPH